jgi:hypothetical protein
VLLAAAGAWLFGNAALLIGMWFTAMRDTRSAWDLNTGQRRVLTTLLLTLAPVGVARWAFLRGQRWHRRAVVQLFIGLPVACAALLVVVIMGR